MIIVSGLIIMTLSTILGFIFCDQKKGISIRELRVSGVIAVIISVYLSMEMYENPITTLLSMMFTWLMLVCGMIIGEIIKIKVFNIVHEKEADKNKVSVRIMSTINKVIDRG